MDEILAQQSTTTSSLDLLLDLMRRLPPEKIETNLKSLIEILPDLTDDLLTSIDQPLKIKRCQSSGRDFLNCDYNRDQDSYRSPWTNVYEPEISEGTLPSVRLRKLEITLNDAFDKYRELYYEGGVSSVYLWDLDEDFAGVVLFKKNIDPSDQLKGTWDSIHVFETTERGRNAQYKLTSTVMLHLVKSNESLGELSLAGSMTRQHEQTFVLSPPSTSTNLSTSHLNNIGKLVEEMEMKMRSLLKEVYFSKTKDIINDLRSIDDLNELKKRVGVQKELVGLLRVKGQGLGS
ncbi:F-actin-capping protein subunit beta [Melampsora americana]|nr:F-actin-capping protein subunit beta [Melampsora americana]